MTSSTLPRLLTTNEAAEILRRNPATLRWWRSQDVGVGPRTTRIGGRVLYREDDLLAFIEAGAEQRAQDTE